ncbi:hypothetical protein BDY19DRAFT_238167 [Irpex rosettiformis]|uniref:Uncharacterized protein n=1 Tax=Irpex rosettiformis TaxID=378272 RepID=A0ACB8U058_9APHY|nr:hypothetical protein BDY19DRAFT_238167 [Irpex rosettiformis]
MQSKRPPNLSLQIGKRPPPKTVIELATPVDDGDGDIEDEEEDGYHSSPLSSSSSESQDTFEVGNEESDDITKDLALLAQLRRSVRNNLRLRPIRSASGSMRISQTDEPVASSSQSSYSPPDSLTDSADLRSPSPDSEYTPASAYFTPLDELRATPLSAVYDFRKTPVEVSTSTQPPLKQPTLDASFCGVSPALLLSRLSSPTRPLLIDTRPVASFTACHMQHSVNMAIPSLILRRSRKTAGAFTSLDALRQFITTEEGKRAWDDLISGEDWDGDVVVYDQAMLQRDRHNTQATAWAIMDIIAPLLLHGSVDFLEGGFAAARGHSYLSQLLITSSDAEDGYPSRVQRPTLSTPPAASASHRKPLGGLSQLDTQAASRSKPLPEVERAAPSPLPIMSTSFSSWSNNDISGPSPAPSSTVFSRPQPPRRPSIPSLRRLDTDYSSPPSLPRLQVPMSSSHLSAPSAEPTGKSLRSRSRSPSHLNLTFSTHSPPPSARLLSSSSRSFFEEDAPHTPSFSSFSPPRSPKTPMPRSPATARPDDQPPTTEEPFPEFTVSTILPNFLFLGPELTIEDHVEQLQSHGVKRIVNIAAECDDDHGLHLRERFEKYVHIPMRDTVEEDNITKGVRDVCTILDDARLHSAPTYVHCKAGKSRSVTAVMAYLIHANHWTLSKAYEFVLDRRRGISPNIGFVSELMTFEEQELGGKSVGVMKMPQSESNTEGAGGGTTGGNYGVALGGRRPQHIRESLPPTFVAQHSFNLVPTMVDTAQLGDSQQELEIKDSEGRYRHARRAPVNATTLQPTRRVSKAGLESSAYV